MKNALCSTKLLSEGHEEEKEDSKGLGTNI